jgi:hypothetical protein
MAGRSQNPGRGAIWRATSLALPSAVFPQHVITITEGAAATIASHVIRAGGHPGSPFKASLAPALDDDDDYLKKITTWVLQNLILHKNVDQPKA